MVTDVLQLPEVMAGHQHRGAVFGHVGEDQTHDLPPHDGVQTVHRLVQHQKLRAAGHREPEGRLLFHALGKFPDGGLPGQVEGFAQFFEASIVESGIQPLVVPAHILNGGRVEEKEIIGDEADSSLCTGILPDGLAVQRDFTAVGSVNAGDVPDQCGLTGSVGSHEAVDRAPGDGHIQVLEGCKGPEGFRQISYFKHCFHLL